MEDGSLDFRALIAEKRTKRLPNTYTKRTLLHSPVIRGIYPQFRVSLSKPLSGLSSSSINDEADQTLHAPVSDSYFGDSMSDDDDIVWNFEEASQKSDQQSTEEEFSTVKVMVRTTSVSVNGVEFALNSGVRSCAVVPGVSGGEDSLLLSIQSGFVLLVRIWRVPRSFGDASFSNRHRNSIETTTSHYFKPLVVQWWKTDGDNSAEMTGSCISAHASGMAVVSASASSVFRIHMCQSTSGGAQLLPHFNVPVNGVILHSCFAQPLPLGGDNHLTFLAVTFSNLRRLDLNLFSWHVSDTLTNNLTKCTLPLNNSFPVPVMVIPLARNHAFLFVAIDMFVVVTMHNITSADYSFRRYAYDGTFPTSFYLPETEEETETEGDPELEGEADKKDEKDKNYDKVYLSSDSGVIYSVEVGRSSLTYDPVIQVADPISVFTLQKDESGYLLNFASDSGGAKEILLSSLFPKGMVLDGKLPFSEATLVQDFRNWAPVVDVLVTDTFPVRNMAPYCSQEVWTLTGVGKRMKLTQLRSGYMVHKKTKPVAELRKADALFPLTICDRQFIFCSVLWGTKLLEYGGENEAFVEIETPPIITDEDTICVAVLGHSRIPTVVQFTPSRIAFSNMETTKVLDLGEYRIVHAKVSGKIAALIVERELVVSLQIYELACLDFSQDLQASDMLQEVCSADLSIEVSTMFLFVNSDTIWLFVGGFDSTLTLLECSKDKVEQLGWFELDKVNPYQKPTPNPKTLEPVVPHDLIFLPHNYQVFVGTDSGHVIQLGLSYLVKRLNLRVIQFLKLGCSPVRLHLCPTDPNLLLVSLRNLWLFNFYASSRPMQVAFDEKTDRAVWNVAEIPSKTDQHLQYVFAREDGLLLGSLFCHKVPLLKQISVGDAAKKVCFLDSVNLFAILCKCKEPLARLRIVDRKSNRMLPTVEVDYKTGSQRTDPVFGNGEMPVCGFVWRIQRLDRVSKKLLVGTSINNTSGSIKILDVSKIAIGEGTGVKVVELVSIAGDAPVTCIEQIGSTIFFSSGCKIYSTSYSFDNKKLRPIKTLTTLSSDVVSMSVDDDDHLLVNTRLDSLIVFKYHENDVDMENSEEEALDSLSVSYKDPVARSLVNHASLGSKIVAGSKLHSSVVIMDSSKSSAAPFSYTMSMIPRVFISKFNACWATEEQDRILSVGVNGELVALDPVYDNGLEISKLNHELDRKLSSFSGPSSAPKGNWSGLRMEWFIERLNRPFADKVTGKGFQNIYKPYFDFPQNTDSIIDYDLEDLATSQTSTVMI